MDLDNLLSVEALVHLIRGRDRAPLMELPGAFLQSAVSGPEGRFAHELIVPFVRSLRPQASPVVPAVSMPLVRKGTRSFPPGSDWLYLKLYTAPSAADRVLVEQVAPLLRELVQAGSADRWFFLRYMDPDLHLRIRVHGEGVRLLSEARPALEALSAAMHQEGRVWRIQWDTYDREVERYGGPEGIEIAEQVFHADSEAVVEILGELRGEVGLRKCWQLALHGLDRMLEDARLDEPAKLQLMSRAARGYRREFPADKRLDVQLGQRFRRERKVLEPLLDPTKEVAPDVLRLLGSFHRRSHRLRPLLRALCTCEREGTLEAPLPEIILSYLHLFVNRMIRSAARAHELVLYDFLSRIYASRLARMESQGAGHSGQKAKERAQ